MFAATISNQLEEVILEGNFAGVKRLLNDVVDFADIKAITKEFPDRDPVVCAIDHELEQIAVYLVEKKFSHDHWYNYPGEECEAHCYASHEGKKCAGQYNAAELAAKKNMTFLVKVLGEIQSGQRQTGDSLRSERRISKDSTSSRDKQQWITQQQRSEEDKYCKLAKQLEKLIMAGDYDDIKKLLNPIVQMKEVEAISEAFQDQDPLIRAIQARQDKVACYLIEKGFPYNEAYNYPGQECDEWCCRLHTADAPGSRGVSCPNQYTALDAAKTHELGAVQALLEAIMAGNRRVGDALRRDKRVSVDGMALCGRDDVCLATEESRTATQLAKLIDARDLGGVKALIDPITDTCHIKKIEHAFDDRDPVTFAVDIGAENIANYLIERSFSFDKPYAFPGQECDCWCYSGHGGRSCPSFYTAISLAEKRGLNQVGKLMDDVQQGMRTLQLA